MKVILWFAKKAVNLWLYMLHPITIVGQENIPEAGAFILCPNHISMLDPIIFILRLKRQIRFMAKVELFNNKVLASALYTAGAFPVDRGRASISAIRESLKTLKDGQGLGIFPQGTRSTDGDIQPMHSGAAMIAQLSGAPIIPAYIDGKYEKFKRTHIYIGKQVDASEFTKKTDSRTLTEVTKLIEESIWALKS